MATLHSLGRRTWMTVASAIIGHAVLGTARADDQIAPPPVDWAAHRLTSTDSIKVMWVGHSLVEATVPSSWGDLNLMSLVGRFAEARGLQYEMTDHTLFGSPLSALWRGQPHSYNRDARSMVEKREAFFKNKAASYNALVLTEGVPLAGALRHEFSSFYLRSFYCAQLKANPKARVYLYQTWVHLQGSHLSPTEKSCLAGFDWRAAMAADRTVWEELADSARKPSVRTPGWLSRLGWSSYSDAGCTNEDPIYMIPVGNAFVALEERLSAPHEGDDFAWPGGRRMQISDLVQNPVVTNVAGELPCSDAPAPRSDLRDHSRDMDDIHPSLAGIYLGALVHFAVLYRQSPVGLPAPGEIGEPLAKTLQCIAWQTVLNDERTGVSGDPAC